MLRDPYAVLRALLRAEAVRNAPKPSRTQSRPDTRRLPQPQKEQDRG